jgi:glycosyltransferase involved in cell wall biosynthesis
MAIARLRRVPYIVRTIGQLSPWSLKQGFIRKKFMIEMIEGANLKHANAIHVTSNYELRDLELLGLDSHGFTLGLGVSLPYQSVNTANDPDQLDKKVSFLYLSRIHPKKQIELLFEALNILKIKLHEENWELALAGTGEADYLDRLKKEAKTLSIDGHLVMGTSPEGKNWT